jgi:hypothetical protein
MPQEPKPPKAAKKPRARKAKIGAAQKAKKDARGTPKGRGTVSAKGGKIGNPPFVPTDEQRAIVRTHAACGTPHWLIAEVGFTPPISVDTLTRHFRNELDTGLLQVNSRMASLIAKQGLGGCRTSQRLWMTTRGGWSVKSTQEFTGPDGGPIPVQGVPARNPNLGCSPPKNWPLTSASSEAGRPYR